MNKKLLTFTPGAVSNAVLVDLDSGELHEFGLRKGSGSCAAAAVVDEPGQRIVQYYEKLGMACKKGSHIEVYRMPLE